MAVGLKVDVSKVIAMQPVEDIGKPVEDIGKPVEDIGNKDARNVDVSREEEQPFGLSWKNWVMPPGLKGIHCIKRCLQKRGLGDQTSNIMDLLHIIKSVAIAAGSDVGFSPTCFFHYFGSASQFHPHLYIPTSASIHYFCMFWDWQNSSRVQQHVSVHIESLRVLWH